MKEKFLNVKCIIDGVEFKIALLSSFAFHKLVNSDYKSHTAVKVIAPDLHQVILDSILDKGVTFSF